MLPRPRAEPVRRQAPLEFARSEVAAPPSRLVLAVPQVPAPRPAQAPRPVAEVPPAFNARVGSLQLRFPAYFLLLIFRLQIFLPTAFSF